MTIQQLASRARGGLLAAILITLGCAGEGAEQAADPPAPQTGDGAAAVGAEGAPGIPVEPAVPAGDSPAPRRRTARPPAAPRYFAHARFVPATAADGTPLGLQVESVLPGGRVALAGLQVGDLVHAIDGVALDDPATFDRAVRLAEDIFLDRRPQHMVVTREGRKVGLMPLGPVATEPAPPPAP